MTTAIKVMALEEPRFKDVKCFNVPSDRYVTPDWHDCFYLQPSGVTPQHVSGDRTQDPTGRERL